ncbi:MAG: outer membrane protein assembly factor BamA [Acidobacteria bacterium]|nr:MAG: outer membrane protein assembly factor BamA [Acidobacteriota bacterium]
MAMRTNGAVDAEMFQLPAVLDGEHYAAAPAFHVIASLSERTHTWDWMSFEGRRLACAVRSCAWRFGFLAPFWARLAIIAETITGAPAGNGVVPQQIRLPRAGAGDETPLLKLSAQLRARIRSSPVPARLRPSVLTALLVIVGMGSLGAAAQAGAPAPAASQVQITAQYPNTIFSIECHGNHRIPCQTIQARMGTKPGSVYDPVQINRDFNSVWNLGAFDNVTFSIQRTPKGIILDVTVTEKPLVRDIKYEGLKSITDSDILDRYQARGVHLERDAPYDPTTVKHAVVAIKELLAEHGRQFASVTPVLNVLPPSSVNLIFKIDEGPQVKVGKIAFKGNKVLSHGTLLGSMKELHPIGIPHSLIFEHLFSRTYDAAKLSADMESIREAYQDRGYFEALVEDPTIKLRTTHGHKLLFFGASEGRRVDLTIPVVEGNKYRVGKISFINNRFITNDATLMNLLGLKPGDVMDVSKLRKGLKNLTKAYGQYGYINFVANPEPAPDEKSHSVNIVMDMQEGKPFYVRHIEFSGNTTTRDRVIRRELLLDEGSRFNSVAWQNSILRLNQLGYFDAIKPEDATITQDTSGPVGEVDVNLHVKEKGKNSISLNGGVSGIAGSFLGLGYSTNNFLGLGETLGVTTDYGSLQRNVTFSFTEPYVKDRPLQLGFSAYINDFHYDQAREASILSGQNLSNYFAALGASNLLNYAQNSHGFTFSASYPKPRSFTRYGIAYRWDNSTVVPFTPAASLLFNSVAFNGISGPNSLNGIVTSEVIPSFTINTVDNPTWPTHGKNIFLSLGVSGLGGNVKILEPQLQLEYFHPAGWHNVLAMRFLGNFVTGYGGVEPPNFDRFFTGGEDTVRGFDILAVTPIALIPTETAVTLQDPFNPGQPLTKNVPNPTPGNPNGTIPETFTVKIPTYQFATPGGDTMAIGNLEYRIPITQGQIPVSVAFFTDAGVDMITQHQQLQVSSQVLNTLQTSFGRPFSRAIPIAKGTNSQIRMSAGVELEVTLPIIHAPVRLYYAVNPGRVDTLIRPPQLFTKADFERGIPGAFLNDADVQRSIAFTMGQLMNRPGTPFREAPHVLRFTIGRTF